MASRNLTPTEGARLLLERLEDRGASASYRVSIYTPTDTFVGEARLDEEGGVELASFGAPREQHAALEMLAKLTARGALKRRLDGLDAWPARVMRWRGAGRGGA